MKRTVIYLLMCLGLAVVYVAVAVINRRYSWEWGREWLAPIMMILCITAPLCYTVVPGGTRRCCR